MDNALLILVAMVLAQTSYLTFKTVKKEAAMKGDILLDTSVLIDGRIVAIARSGLMNARLVVLRSVVRELQFMADKADHDKRERARYGLDVIEKLQQLPTVTVSISDDGTTSQHGVDEQLIVIAQKTGAKLCTIDYNLNKAARVQAVDVININELAHALRVIHLPGETIEVELVQPGQDKKQAVGYLDDGTMVVVEDSRSLMGQTVTVELTRTLQTAAGRMMFAKRKGSKQPSGDSESHRHPAPKPVSDDSEKKGRRPASQPRSEQTEGRHRSAGKPSSGRQRQGGGRRKPSSPEDALVNLANK